MELAQATIEYLTQSQSQSGNNFATTAATRPESNVQADTATQSQEPKYDISMFTVDPGAPHYCLVFLNIPEVNTDIMKIRLADFNRRSYSQDNLRISGENWDEDYYMVYIYTLKTASIAQGFLEELRESKYVFGSVPKEFYTIMLIHAENFMTFMKLRNKEAYQYFFEQNYNP